MSEVNEPSPSTDASASSGTISITIKSQNQRQTLDILPSDDIQVLREKLAEKFTVDKACVTLIYSGKILRDGCSIKSNNIENGHIVHMVIREPKPSTAQATSTTNTSSTTTSNSNSGTTTQPGTRPSTGGVFDMFESMMGSNLFDGQSEVPGAGGAGGMGMPNMEQITQMMNNPVMEEMMTNPDLIQNIFSSSPGFQNILDRNPELNHFIRNPDTIRQALQTMRNPAAFQEMLRNRDRAMSNLESMPGGYNALRRMYTEMEEPMFEALSGQSPFESGNNGQQGNGANATPSTTENRDPLPNPWDRSASAGSNNNNSTTNASATPGTGAAGAGAGAAGGLGNLFAGLGGLGNLGNMFGNMGGNAAAAGAAPGAAGGLGGLGAALGGANVQEMMRNMMGPNGQGQMNFMQRVMGNPDALQALMDIQRGYTRLSQALGVSMMDIISGNVPATPPSTTGTTTTNPTTTTAPSESQTGTGNANNNNNTSNNPFPGFDPATLSSMMNLLSGLNPNAAGAGAGAGGAAASQQPPEERYAAQLQQLEQMGFTNRERNLRALLQTFGSVEAAIERILSEL